MIDEQGCGIGEGSRLLETQGLRNTLQQSGWRGRDIYGSRKRTVSEKVMFSSRAFLNVGVSYDDVSKYTTRVLEYGDTRFTRHFGAGGIEACRNRFRALESRDIAHNSYTTWGGGYACRRETQSPK
jgi:hypothetical protein